LILADGPHVSDFRFMRTTDISRFSIQSRILFFTLRVVGMSAPYPNSRQPTR